MGEYAGNAVLLSVLLKLSPEEAIELVHKNVSPRKLSDLAIGGEDLSALGFCGREIGRMLQYLFELTMDCPELNTREELIKTAIEKQKGKGE